MARADEGGERLALRCDQRLLERNTLIAWQHWFTSSDQTVSVAHRRRDMSDFIAARLALASCAAELAESFEKE